MARFEHERSAAIGDARVRVAGRGVAGHVIDGLALATRGGRAPVDPIQRALDTLERAGSGGFTPRAQFTVEVDDGARTRGAGAVADPAVLIDVPPVPGERQLAIVDADGFRYFVVPDDEGRFEIPVTGAGTTTRGLTQVVGRFAVRVIGLVAKDVVGAAVEHAVRSVEERLRPLRLRSFADGDHLARDAEPFPPARLGQGPSLLLVHGFNSAAHETFRFDREYVRALQRRYDGRIAAFDHPSLSHSPRENAEWLANHIGGVELAPIDVLAHSRGGLVARELLAVLDRPAIRSIVFVATPNSGTPLADGAHLGEFVGMAANLSALIPDNPVTDSIGIGLEVMRSWVLEPALGALTGISCASPGSEVLDRLSERDAGETVFRAIASHFEPRSGQGALQVAFDRVMDRAFHGDPNDLLVPTRSCYEQRGRFHIGADRRLVLDHSFGVTHSTFWSERVVLRQLDQWLDPHIAIDAAEPVPPELTDPTADAEQAARTGDVGLLRRTTARARGGPAGASRPAYGGAAASGRDAPPSGGSRGAVVVLPGFFGSRLRIVAGDGDGELVWFNPWALVRGRFAALEYPGPDADGRRVLTDGLMPQYVPLLTRLAAAWDVYPFAYDWRADITDLADELAGFLTERQLDLASGERPVHLVGHGMGGVVAGAYLLAHHEAWSRGAGRFVQLGTPNRGSYAMLAALLGDDAAVRAIAAADLDHDPAATGRAFCSFPSVYQLLPSPAGDGDLGADDIARLYVDRSWLDGGGEHIDGLLARAKSFHERMQHLRADDRFVYVAGDGQPTPARARIDAAGKVSFGVTTGGDGRVSHDLGHEALGVDPERTFFVPARHGDLAADDRVLDALGELLENGTTDLLPAQPADRRGRADVDGRWVPSGELERSLGIPSPSTDRGFGVDEATARVHLELAAKLHLGGGDRADVAPALRVRVVHGSMEQAKYAVAAGRYKGIPMEGATAFLDRRLDGALSRLQEFDLFPENAGTARYVPPPDELTCPKGAIVVGLGEFGQLSSTQLTRAIERGVIEYAVAQRGGSGGTRTLGVSSVLIGTPGRYGLSVQSSVFATVQGVARAAARLQDFGIVIDDLELIELYEGKAEEAALAIAQLVRAKRFDGMEVPIDARTRLILRPGGRPGSGGYEESGAPWLRLQLRLDDTQPSDDRGGAGDADPVDAPTRPRSQILTWTSLGRSSQAERLEVNVPIEEIRRHVRAAVLDPAAANDTNLTLFEMLFPHDAKLELDERDNLQLLVDESTAWIPWELVTGRDTNGNLLQPLARRAGVLRQLIPREAERTRRTFRPIGRKALVIGDPPGDPRYWPRLPGARDEARRVARILRDDGYDVTECIYDGDAEPSAEVAADIRNAFFRDHYGIIHIAAHGTFDEGSDDAFANGVVIGPGEILSAAHVEDRLVTPDLVFLNCCHIGRIDAPDGAAARRRSSYAELAASMSLQLMKIGVRAVVAAGWAVDDRAASVFAECFYSQMIAGGAFGEAVGVARNESFDVRSNTWGAYQCYGDPDFQFSSTRRMESDSTLTVLSSAHLVKHLRALQMTAGDAAETDFCDEVAERLRAIEREHLADFAAAEVSEAFAAAYAAAGAFDDAVVHYRAAVEADTANATMRAMEQLANIESRLAALNNRDGVPPGARIQDEAVELCRHAERRLDQLIEIKPTPERLALRGSLHKRWASMSAAGADREHHLRASRDAYEAAAELSRNDRTGELDVHHGCQALQLAYLAGCDGFEPGTGEARWAAFLGYREQLERQLDALDRNPSEGSYYERARWIDILASLIVFDGRIGDENPDGRRYADEIADGFSTTFRVRSSARERRSVIDHYTELSVLFRDEAHRRAARYIADRLQDD